MSLHKIPIPAERERDHAKTANKIWFHRVLQNRFNTVLVKDY
jgi:hypothetical protein